MLCCSWLAAAGSVLPITIPSRQRGSPVPEIHHLWPLTTQSSPSRSMRVWMFVASELATAGSVIRKAERICPASSGRSHRSCCAAVPNRVSSSMFPVSGAEQFSTSGAMNERPRISQSGA